MNALIKISELRNVLEIILYNAKKILVRRKINSDGVKIKRYLENFRQGYAQGMFPNERINENH